MKEQWGDWISQRWRWDWFATLTFDQERAAFRSADHTVVGWAASAKRWDDWLSSVFGGDSGDASGVLPSIYWLRGREPNPWRAGTHFHALIGGVPTGTSRRAAWASWFKANGVARIEPYDPRRGAGYYVSKYVVKELGDIQFSGNAADYMLKEVESGNGNGGSA